MTVNTDQTTVLAPLRAVSLMTQMRIMATSTTVPRMTELKFGMIVFCQNSTNAVAMVSPPSATEYHGRTNVYSPISLRTAPTRYRDPVTRSQEPSVVRLCAF